MDGFDLAGLLAARLCHDLAGPVGSIGNGAELLADETDPAVRDQFTRLMADAARQASRRLVFYRLAVGGAADGFVAPREAEAALRGTIADGCALDWLPDAPLSRPEARLTLLLGMVAGEALREGGKVTVAAAGTVEAAGAGASLPAGIAAALAGAAAHPVPKLAPALFAAEVAARAGRRIAVAEGPGRVHLAAV